MYYQNSTCPICKKNLAYCKCNKSSEGLEGIKIEEVSRYTLGDGVLGRAFPGEKIIQIAYDLYGGLKEKVLHHEILHVLNPHWSEFRVRLESNTVYVK